MRRPHLVLVALPVAAALAGFDWDAVTPTEDLQYHPCYDGYQCALLTVPVRITESESSLQSVFYLLTSIAGLA